MRAAVNFITLAYMSARKRLNKFVVFIALLLVMAGLFAYWLYLRSTPPLNIVLVSIDTLRPDHLGCYGHHRNTSPAIDRLAREGARFETVASSTSWTLPAHASMLTSQPDILHRVLWDDDKLDPNRISLAEILQDNGYRTGAVFTGPYLLPRFGLDQGFDDYMDATLYDKDIDNSEVLKASEKGRTTPRAMDMMEEWLDRGPEKPFFFFLHLFDAHPDFVPPPPYDTMFDPGYNGDITGRNIFNNDKIHKNMDKEDLEHLIALYDGEIRFVDEAGIKRLLQILSERDLLDNTLIIITSDHGEEFFEHGEMAHRNNLYDTTLLVPLIIWRPGLIKSADITGRQVRIVDIMPTVLDVLGMGPCPEATGLSLVPLIENPHGDHGPRPNLAELTGGRLHMEALRQSSSKFIFDYKKRGPSYFDLDKDPAEKNPLALESNQKAQKAANKFHVIREKTLQARDSLKWGDTGPQKMDPELRERLESLGYIE